MTTASAVVQDPAGPPTPDARQILADVVWLMMSAPNHKHLFLSDLEWLVVPPILAGQFRVFKREGVPVAYASWAFLTEEAEQRLLAGHSRLKLEDWSAGDRAWLIDLTAPFGGAEDIARELKAKVFAGSDIKTLKPSTTGVGVEAMVFGGECNV
ncbi:MAG: toxin-activating lysine-acyltransferase [Rhodospirillales bacterium]|nr:toxin-activating lysine-acyltransferase [Rhodospirillales bacterium]